MKKRHFILFSILLFHQFILRAQYQQGDVFLGGVLGANGQQVDAERYPGGHIDPAIVFFLTNRLAAGAILTFGLAFNGENGITNFGGGPQVRYYVSRGEKFRVFGQCNAVLLAQKTGAYHSRTVPGWGAAAGANIFLKKRIAFEISLGYDFVHKGTFQQQGLGKFGITFGVLGVFHRREKFR